jgi:hypothetical protein
VHHEELKIAEELGETEELVGIEESGELETP